MGLFNLVAVFALLGLAAAVPLRQSVANNVNLAAAADNTAGEYNGAVASEPLPAALKNAEAALEQANDAVGQAAAALDTSGAATAATDNDAATETETKTETKAEDAAPAAAEDTAPATAKDTAPATAKDTAPATAEDTAPAAAEDTAPAAAEDTAPATSDEAAPATSDEAAAAAADPCKSACTPKIDVKASVMESYKRHRAQAALIGDYGSCGVGGSGQYTWTVDWGDDESYEHRRDAIGPYQAEHIYSKKGKYTVEATFCHKLDGCDSGCTSYSKKLNVKP